MVSGIFSQLKFMKIFLINDFLGRDQYVVNFIKNYWSKRICDGYNLIWPHHDSVAVFNSDIYMRSKNVIFMIGPDRTKSDNHQLAD